IHIPPRSNDKLIEIGTKQIVYDSLHNFVYLNNNNTLIQFDFVSGKSRLVTAAAILGDKIETSRRVIDYTIDTDGRLWFLIPSYGIRIVDPMQFKCVDSIPLGTNGYLPGNYYYIRNGGRGFMCMVGVEGTLVYNYHEKKSWLLNHSNGTAATFDYFFGRCRDYFFANEVNAIFYYRISDFSKIDFTKSSILNTLFANDSLVYTRSERNTGDTIRLKHFQNNISFSFSTQEFFYPERIEYAYQLSGIDRDWHYTHALNRKINYTRLSPGEYVLRLKAQFQGGDWEGGEKKYHIIITPAFWQTDWFKLLTVAIACTAIFAFARWRIVAIGKKEQQRIVHEKDLLELEARALRAQMNPHFIFNSLNSIKSLINKNENEKAAEYLTTFSKLIRTLFLNSDNREVSLHEEIETCKLYAQIERMRFGDKVDFGFDIDQNIDLKDIRVPALIIQPFIENAIWHGLVPKEQGGRLLVTVRKNNGAIECIIDDNGIGRELSLKYKAQYESSHQSRGISLTRTRLELDKFLNNREDGIEIIDKLDEYGKPAGTTVILTFKDNIV
ncbi:MAG TPA: histidine kinase, partial [Chitinophagaceae bacterium]|nr:histidine kinase [Chitinophagaceae bacterium]